MATALYTHVLHDTEDFMVESAEGPVGRVEELWLGPTGQPQALAVRMRDGRRALLLDEDVRAVDRERRWVVVRPEVDLLELDVPRIQRGKDGRPAASWATTGAVVHPDPPRRLPRLRLVVPHPAVAKRPFWQQIAILYAALTAIVCVGIGLVFLISWAVGGAPY
jgi:hypothetical protein